MDELNNQGILGSSDGNLYFLDLNENIIVRIVSRAMAAPESVSQVLYDTLNQKLLYSTAGVANGDVKLYSSDAID